MKLVSRWGVLSLSSTRHAAGELAFQKAATVVWKHLDQLKHRHLIRSGQTQQHNQRARTKVPMPSSLFVDFEGFKIALKILSKELFPARRDST